MKHFRNAARMALAAASAGAVAIIGGCGNERTAEADTPVSEAEVSTDLPESAVSDERLQASADAAAQVAATPPSEVIAVPVPAGNGAATTGNARPANNAVSGNTTTR